MESPAGAARVAAKGPAENLRMLVELESSARPMSRGSARGASIWITAIALLAAAVGGTWWWTQHREAPTLVQPAVRLSAAAPRATPAATPAGATAKPALPASGPLEAAPAAARIEAAGDARPVPVVPVAMVPAPVPTAATITAKASETALAPPLAVRLAKTPTPTHAKSTHARPTPAPPARAAAAAPAVAHSAEPGAAAATKDADIVLLSALLAHVSRDAQGAPMGSQAQLTIAQIVQRCEARGGKDTAETRECRRRICDGYWGKAQACPARLAPKKG
jgi:hypothetical protein